MTEQQIAALAARHGITFTTLHVTYADLPPAMQARIRRLVAKASRALNVGLPRQSKARRWPW